MEDCRMDTYEGGGGDLFSRLPEPMGFWSRVEVTLNTDSGSPLSQEFCQHPHGSDE